MNEVPPGWYPDPGATGQLRWWDGSAWSAHVRPAEPVTGPAAGGATYGGAAYGGAAGGPQRTATSTDARTEELTWGPQGERARPAKAPLIALGALAVVLLLVMAGFLVAQGGGGGDERAAAPGPSASAPPSPEPRSPSASPSAAPADPTSRRVVDPASGLSYERLGGEWEPWSGRIVPTGAGSAGEFTVTQEDTPSHGNWIANAFLGRLDPVTASAGDLRAAALAAAKTLERSDAYPAHTRKDLAAAAFRTEDGHQGYRVTMKLTFTDAAGLDAKDETVSVGVVEIGNGVRGVVYVSIPGNRADLMPAMDKVFSTLRVEDPGGASIA